MMTFAEVEVLGVRFHRLLVEQLLDFIVSATRAPTPVLVMHVNVHAVNLAQEDARFRDALARADLTYCDGMGVLLGARLLGHAVDRRERMTAPDFLVELARRLERGEKSLFLLAGRPGVADRAASELARRVPGLRVASHHGYFSKDGPENEEVLRKIRAFAPDLLCVGFGMPLQEIWLVENLEASGARVGLTIGACLDFFVGAKARGPRFLTDHGLEWAARLATEPLRLGRRYLQGNPRFLLRVLGEAARSRRGQMR